MPNWADYWKKTAKGSRDIPLGPAPYTADGYKRDPILGEILDPKGQQNYQAQQAKYNLDLKENAMQLPKIDDTPWYSKLLNNPAVKTVGWLAHQVDRPFNAVEGALEQPYLNKEANGHKTLSTSDLLGGVAKGAWDGFLQKKDYNFGRAVEKFAPEDPSNPGGFATTYQDIVRARPIRALKALNTNATRAIFGDKYGPKHDDFFNQTPDQMRGKSGPQTDKEYAGMANMTSADILGAILNFKAAVFPARIGRVVQDGAKELDVAATTAAKVAREAEVAANTSKILKSTSKANIISNLVDGLGVNAGKVEQMPYQALRKGWNEFGKTGRFVDSTTGEILHDIQGAHLTEGVPRGTGTVEDAIKQVGYNRGMQMDPLVADVMKTADPKLRKALQVYNPGSIVGAGPKWATPLANQQFSAFDKIGQGTRDLLAKAPGLERALSHVSNRVESSATRGASKLFDDVDNSRLGYKGANENFDARMVKSLRDTGSSGLTDNQQIAMYHATTSSKALDDPAFLSALEKHYKIPATELQDLTKLEPMRQWWLQEAKDYAAKGEAAGILKPRDMEYMPIRFKKPDQGNILENIDQQLGKEFGGLRGIQKTRSFDAVKDWEKLIEEGSKGNLAVNKFDEAAQYYSRVFHGIERRRNLLGSLESRGLVSRSKKDGFSTLSDVFDVGSNGTPVPDQYFINDRVKQRFVDEIFGYGGKKSPILQGINNVQNPWKAAVTTLNPRYHFNNMIDDLVRNKALDDVGNDAYKAAISRPTGDTWTKGATIKDWVKNAQGQWEYAPGVKNTMDLSSHDAWNLANKMGVSTVETSEIANRGKGLFKRVIDRSERIQGVSREANFLSQLKKYGNSDFAKQVVDQNLINYRDLSPFLRDVVRPFAPFTTFRIKNPQVALNQLLMNPTAYGKFGMVKNMAEGELKKDTPDYLKNYADGQAHLPSYYRDKPVIGFKDGKNTGIADFGLSQFDFANLISPNHMGETLRRLPGPALQIPIGLASGKDSLNRSIDGPQKSGWLDGLIFGKKGGDGTTYTDGRTKFIMDSILGQPAKYHSQGNTLRQDVRDQIGTKTYNTQGLMLQALQQQIRDRTTRMSDLKFYGSKVPSAPNLKQDRIFMEAFSKNR
jgi:hypothetical protein